MVRSSQFWTADKAAGAVLMVIGTVAFLVKTNLLQLKIDFPVLGPVVHVWPFAIIAAGIVMLWAQKRGENHNSAGNGERE